MKKNKSSVIQKTPLRKKAEKEIQPNMETENLPLTKIKELVHELQVHEIELEMQNDELKRSNLQIEALLTKYHDLYEFAPVGFLTLDENGIIEEANLTATTILEKERRYMVKRRFQSFISSKCSENFYVFLRNVFKSDKKETTEIILQNANRQGRWVRLDAAIILNENIGIKKCRLSIIDIDERKKAEDMLKASLEDKERMKIILKTQEEERSRFAESLHNGLGQILYATKLRMEQIDMTTSDSAKENKRRIDELLLEAINETARISYELVPRLLQDYGLIEAIKELVNRIPSEKLPISFFNKGFEKRVNPDIEIAIFRIVQELCSNIIKHSKAKTASIYLLKTETFIRLMVEDNGIGFNIDDENSMFAGLGLKGIRGRVLLLKGKIDITSNGLHGTRFVIEIPR